MNRTFAKNCTVVLLVLALVPVLSSCRTLFNQFRMTKEPAIIDPRFPYAQHNLDVMAENAKQDVQMSAEYLGKVAQKPKVAVNSFVDGYNDISNRNPYDRQNPYYYDDYKREVLATMGKEMMDPLGEPGMLYPTALRSNYMTGRTDVDLTSDAIAYKKQLDEVSAMVTEATALRDAHDFTGALGKINQAMDIDPANEAVRTAYAETIRAQEQFKFEQQLASERAEVADQKAAAAAEVARVEDEKKTKMVERYAAEIELSLKNSDFEEAARLAQLLDTAAPDNARANEVVDQVDLAVFQNALDPRILQSDMLMQDLIMEHFKRYQEYKDTGVENLARRELKRISFLESLRGSVDCGSAGC